jgi:hypothetical protein
MSKDRRKSFFPQGEGPLLEDLAPDAVDEAAEKRRRASGRFEAPNLTARNHLISRLAAQDTSKNDVNKTVSSPQAYQQITKPSNEQLSCLYNNCVKLLNENKINAKNAFSLKLIDYMSDIVLNKEIVGGTTNFQVVGCTIDVGTKIYAARVDALHQNTYQMLSGLAQNNQNNEDEESGGDHGMDENMRNQNDSDMGDNEDQMNKKAKNKKKRVKKSSQICENLEQITSKARDEFTDVRFFEP